MSVKRLVSIIILMMIIIIRDGSITVHEFLALCEEHGAHIGEEELEAFNKRADNKGEVLGNITVSVIFYLKSFR